MISALRFVRNRILGNRGIIGSMQTETQGMEDEAVFETQQSPSTQVMLTRAEGLKYYTEMETIRQMENVTATLYEKFKAIRGLCHLYTGQEACCVGMEAAIVKDDAVITAYRGHGWAYLRGVSLLGILAEATGRVSGCSKGKGGSMHMYAPKNNFYGGVGIVGAQVPIGSGIAFAMKYENKQNVCLTSYGDGAANQGQVSEAFNIAKLWKLPVIFVCENNGYGMYTGAERAAACTEYYTRGDYIPGIRVDGMDVLAVKEATRFAREFVLENGPIILEVTTYRFHGHSMVEPGTSYRDTTEIRDATERRDPISKHRRRLINSGLATPGELQDIDVDISQEVFEAANQALSDPEPSVEELYNSLFTDPPNDMWIRGCDNSLMSTTTA